MATGLGPEGCLIISMLAKIEPRVYVFNLDTGYLFPETLELRRRIAEKYGIVVDLQQPELSVEEYEAVHGGPLYGTNPDKCCHDRKIAVLHRVAKGFQCVASGDTPRSESLPGRHAHRPLDGKFGLVKVSPLATWTKEDVWKRIVKGTDSLQSAA